MPNASNPTDTSFADTPLDTPAAPKPTGRLESLDICRGIAILAVLFIHVSGHFLPLLHPAKSHTPPTWAWYTLAVPNVDFSWAVPCFLMLSAFANALSLARTPSLVRYGSRRLTSAVLPYVLWSGVYLAVNRALGHGQHLSSGRLKDLLLSGKAEFHLYFFVLAIELYVLLPLLLPLFKRRPPLWAAALGAVVLQSAIYVSNRCILVHQFQSTILWDILPVTLGLWLWSQMGRWPEIFKRGIWPALALTLTAALVYTPLALATLLPPARINTALYQFGQWGFTAGMSFLVLALAGALIRVRLAPLLSYFGAESLAVYVIHPLAIIALDTLGVRKAIGAGAGFVVYYTTCLALPLAAAWLWKQGKLGLAGLHAPK